MAKALLVSSIEGYSGKSGIIMALGIILKKRGYSVGYFKPFGARTAYINDRIIDEDAYSTAEVLNTGDDMDDICPIILDMPYIEFVSTADVLSLKRKIMDAYSRVAEGKDVVLIEGSIDYQTGKSVGLCDLSVAEMLDPSVLMVAKYSSDFALDKLLAAKVLFGEKLRMVVFNQLGGYKRAYIQSVAGRVLSENGMELLGIIPRDSMLGGLFVSEMGEALNAEFLVKPKRDAIVEEIIIGAMSAQAAVEHFKEAKNAVLVTGGDRADLQIVALEMPSIRCMLLTGNIEPAEIVIRRAEENGIPVLLVEEDTLRAVAKLEELMGKARIRGEAKIKKIKELLENYVNVERIIENLQLTPPEEVEEQS
ncbi:phosphotransacetylase family protein [Archaeoglobus veneficus]|uniref:DRTGG domain protein n=1 Tax=Archaeoglobus veneficus (strain DSM 11195 / SNP6) TaxID=693661 RepID=F2KP48_ARCVS|nr:phosphotransacetylase family protein [Archaeoglobus veneficus]AEA46356.1 DRTGG domain protein [Archaeoglobus veneficus SNP6]